MAHFLPGLFVCFARFKPTNISEVTAFYGFLWISLMNRQDAVSSKAVYKIWNLKNWMRKSDQQRRHVSFVERKELNKNNTPTTPPQNYDEQLQADILHAHKNRWIWSTKTSEFRDNEKRTELFKYYYNFQALTTWTKTFRLGLNKKFLQERSLRVEKIDTTCCHDRVLSELKLERADDASKLVWTNTSRASDAKIPYKDKRFIGNPLLNKC